MLSQVTCHSPSQDHTGAGRYRSLGTMMCPTRGRCTMSHPGVPHPSLVVPVTGSVPSVSFHNLQSCSAVGGYPFPGACALFSFLATFQSLLLVLCFLSLILFRCPLQSQIRVSKGLVSSSCPVAACPVGFAVEGSPRCLLLGWLSASHYRCSSASQLRDPQAAISRMACRGS